VPSLSISSRSEPLSVVPRTTMVFVPSGVLRFGTDIELKSVLVVGKDLSAASASPSLVSADEPLSNLQRRTGDQAEEISPGSRLVGQVGVNDSTEEGVLPGCRPRICAQLSRVTSALQSEAADAHACGIDCEVALVVDANGHARWLGNPAPALPGLKKRGLHLAVFPRSKTAG